MTRDMSAVPISTAEGSPMAERISKAAWIWGGWLVVVTLLMGLGLFYGVNLYRQLEAAAWQQSEAVAKLIAVRILGRVEHMDDILLHTQDSITRFGPGLSEQDRVLKARPSLSDVHRVVILSAAAEPILSIPAINDVRDYSGLIERVRRAGKTEIVSYGWADVSTGALTRAMPLQFVDGSFAGAVAVLTPTAWMREALQEPGKSYGLSMRLLLNGQVLAQDDVAQPANQRDAEQRSFDVIAHELVLQVGLRQEALQRLWWSSFKAVVAVLVLCSVALLIGALWLHRAVAQQMRSAVAAELSGREALVKARFLANMSHELRTPMTGVLGAVELLHETKPTMAQRNLMDLIQHSGQHLMNILNDVLDVSRMDFNAMQLDLQPCSLLEVLQDASQILIPKAHLQGIAIYTHLDIDAQCRVNLDAFRLTQVLTNLLGNAIKFTAMGHVVMTAKLIEMQDGHRLQVSVIDTGIGIATDQTQALFQPFSQADLSTSRRFGGSGLGLFICKRLIELMGGQIGVDSRLGEGSRFWFDIPVQPEVLPPKPAALANGLPPQVLVCIWDSLLRESIHTHLKHLGIEPVECDLKRAPPRSIRCVIVDQQSHVSVAALALSGHVPVWVHAGAAHGLPEGTLVEPIRRSQFAHTLRQLAGQAITASPPTSLPVADQNKSLEGLRVLVAEDNPLTRQIVQLFMAGLRCEVIFVEDGQQAIDAIKQHPFDVVLMDCHMPGVDGYQATRSIRELGVHSATGGQLPILALTAATMPEDVALAMAAGMDEVCSKPIDRAHLKARLLHWRQVALAQAVDAER